MITDEDPIEKMAKQGLLSHEIAIKLSLRENDIYRMTPHSWYMLAFQDDDRFPHKDLNSALVSASYSLCRSEKPGIRKQCRKTMQQWWYQAYENYHGPSMDIH